MAEAIKVYTLEEVMDVLKVSKRTIYNYIKAKYPEKTLLFWGDIVEEHPELFKELPDDLLPILWNYSTNTPPTVIPRCLRSKVTTVGIL